MKRKKKMKLERAALQDVARLMCEWSARLGPDSEVAVGLEASSSGFLRLAERLAPPANKRGTS